MKRLASIPSIPPDAAFSLVAAFEADTNEQKVDLCPGFYRDNDAKPWILPSVSQVTSTTPRGIKYD
jgi:aspartate aminotransferase